MNLSKARTVKFSIWHFLETSRKDSTVSTFLPAIGNPFISQVNQNRNNITTSKSVLDFHAPPVIQSRRRSESLLKSTDNLAFKRYYRLDNDSYLSQTHWNDWFGKPGGGAPSFSAHKKNLDHMLEPPRSKNHEYEAFRKNYENLQFRRYDSNHHNFYEIKNPQESSRVHNFYWRSIF